MEIKKIEFKPFKDCYELTIKNKRMVVSAGFGPRILHFGLTGGRNILYVDKEADVNDTEKFVACGGHRLWIAPETMSTYNPDHLPCTVEEGPGSFTVKAVDPRLKMEKGISISGEGDRIVVNHTIKNLSGHLYDGSIWAVTCVLPEGTAFMPWRSTGEWVMNKIVYWQKWLKHGTNIKSGQYIPTGDLFLIKPNGEEGKVGTSGDEGFIGVTTHDYTFIKKFNRLPIKTYPDENCAVQSYQNKDLLELETLGPIMTFQPGLCYEHREEWILADGGINPENGDEVRKIIMNEC